MDLEDLLRRRRNTDTRTVLHKSSEEISSLGELLYPHLTGTNAMKNDKSEFSSIGELLYPTDFQTNHLNEDEENVGDYSVEPIENTDETDVQDQPSHHNHLGSPERVSMFKISEHPSTKLF